MSEVNMYAIFDAKVGAFHVPMFMVNDDVARRAVISAMDQSYELSAHHSDFQLFRLATWDDNTGEISPIQPQVVATLSALHAQGQALRADQRQAHLPLDSEHC